MIIPKKRVLLTVVLALVGLAATVAVAQAAIPIITDITAPPSGHNTAACAGCHVVTPTPIDLPGAGNGTSHDDTDSVEASDDDTDSVGSDDADKATNEADHHHSALKGHGGKDEQAHDAAEKAAEHETVDEQVHERDHQDPQSVDQGGAQHDGSHHKAEGSSD